MTSGQFEWVSMISEEMCVCVCARAHTRTHVRLCVNGMFVLYMGTVDCNVNYSVYWIALLLHILLKVNSFYVNYRL
jgi:hypothetical protein